MKAKDRSQNTEFRRIKNEAYSFSMLRDMEDIIIKKIL
jgi:hypothetical protein